ncbi:MAG: hypothetical protein VX498_14805, partial [Myxococcota bacterium]|nr:hypothetical protein [Myxococcota bacterium]
PGALEELRDRTEEVVRGETRRARWLADLCVFEGYHASLLAATRRAMAGQPLVGPPEQDDPDITFSAYIRWCRSQPESPAETWRSWRAGDFPRRTAS